MNDNYINSIIKGCKVLELFGKNHDLLGITEISQLLDYPISTTFRIVSTLEYCGYLRQDSTSNKYCLGIQNYKNGLNVNMIGELKRIAYDSMKELSCQYNEVTHLTILDHDKVLCIQKISANRSLSATPEEGETNYVHVTSGGKCMLAFSEEKVVNKFLIEHKLVRITPHTITTSEEFLKELKKVRQAGYAVDREESDLGLTCVGAPIFQSQNNCVAAVSISVPNVRFHYEMEELAEAVKAIAQKISMQL